MEGKEKPDTDCVEKYGVNTLMLIMDAALLS